MRKRLSFTSGFPTLNRIAQLFRHQKAAASENPDEIISAMEDSGSIFATKGPPGTQLNGLRDQIASLEKVLKIDRLSGLELRLQKQTYREALVRRLLRLLANASQLR